MFRNLALSAAAAAFALTAAPAAAQATNLQPAVERAEEASAARPAQMPLSVNFDMNVDRENILFLDLSSGERVAIRLVPEWAPNHVERIKTLTREGFYNGVPFHRVIDGFMAQTGDPTGTGGGGSALADLEAEFNFLPHVRGSVSMAREGDNEDSANSQFFIVFYPTFALDRNYTNFGRVISNMSAVDAITRGEPPSNPTRVLQASIAADNIPQAMPRPDRSMLDEEVTLDDLNAPVSE